jgi:hypothetical protein
MEDVGTFYDHLVYFAAICYTLWPFGIFCGNLVYFMVIWYIFPVLVCCTKKNLATLVRCGTTKKEKTRKGLSVTSKPRIYGPDLFFALSTNFRFTFLFIGLQTVNFCQKAMSQSCNHVGLSGNGTVNLSYH